MTTPSTAFIGLGSNLGNPLQQLHQALEALHQLAHTTLTDTSPIYRSAPVGPQDQPKFLNMAARLDTRLTPLELLDRLLEIEDLQGRVRHQTWGPRVIDLDILLFGEESVDHERLQIPHAELPNRDFVLRPLLDLEPELRLPDGRRLDLLLAACPCNNLERLEDA